MHLLFPIVPFWAQFHGAAKYKQCCLAWNFLPDQNSITNQMSICYLLLFTGIQLLFDYPENHMEISSLIKRGLLLSPSISFYFIVLSLRHSSYCPTRLPLYFFYSLRFRYLHCIALECPVCPGYQGSGRWLLSRFLEWRPLGHLCSGFRWVLFEFCFRSAHVIFRCHLP